MCEEMSKTGCANLALNWDLACDCTGIAQRLCTGPAQTILRVDHYPWGSHLVNMVII